MSKSRGNVVNPDDVVAEYGADSLRLYEMFMGPLEATKPWDTAGVSGVARFLARSWRFIMDGEEDTAVSLHNRISDDATLDDESMRLLHKTIKKVTEDIEALRFNTAISQLMVCVNHLTKLKRVPRSAAETYVLLLSPLAPHLGEELWQHLGHQNTLAHEPWPTFDPSLTVDDVVTIAVQVMGKTRGTIDVSRAASKDEVLALAKALPSVAKHLDGKTIRKEIYVPGRIVNLVAT